MPSSSASPRRFGRCYEDVPLLLWVDSGLYCGQAWFEPFGFDKGLLDPATGEGADLFENGLVPHAKLMKSIETFATQVLPRFA